MATADNKIANPFAWLTKTPGMRQLLVLVGLAASISIGVTAAFWMQEPGYTVLFSNISDKESSDVVNTLSSAAIPYQLDNNTGAIKVPSDQLHQARLKLAEQGLPRSSGFGLEIMEGGNSFSTSQFMEGARYHHALETELARTIGSLQPVQSARVHLAVPKSTVFIGKKQRPSASVLLQLYAGRSLTESQVAAIVHLVGSSIPDLDPNQVTIVDQTGRLLSSPDDSSALGLSARQLDYVRRVEDGYVGRIENLLVPMLGAGSVRTTVTAQLDFTQREQTQELYDPETVVRSEQTSEDRTTGGGLLGGIPGALSNQPPAPAALAVPPPAAAAAAGTNPAQNSDASKAAAAATVNRTPMNEAIRQTRNFEMDRTMNHTKQALGAVQRLSVAVLVDEKKVTAADGTVTSQKMSPEELAGITQLVRDAVGYDEARGDTVSVSSMPFYESPPVEAVEPGMMDNPGVLAFGKQALAGLLILVVALLLIKPLLRALGTGASLPAPAYAGATGGGGGGGNSLPADPRAPLSYDDKISVARQLADKNPERVAQIVRAWVQADG